MPLRSSEPGRAAFEGNVVLAEVWGTFHSLIVAIELRLSRQDLTAFVEAAPYALCGASFQQLRPPPVEALPRLLNALGHEAKAIA